MFSFSLSLVVILLGDADQNHFFESMWNHNDGVISNCQMRPKRVSFSRAKFSDLSIVNLEVQQFSIVTRLHNSHIICKNHSGCNQINVPRSSCCPSLVTIGRNKLHFYYFYKIAWSNKNGCINTYQIILNKIDKSKLPAHMEL